MKIWTLGLAAALALAGALPAGAQTAATLPVKDNSAAVRPLAGQQDAAGAFHYRDILEGLTSAGVPDPLLTDGAGHFLVTPGAATSARQDALLAALGAPLQAGGHVTVDAAPLPPGAATAAAQATNTAAVAQDVAANASYAGAVALTVGTAGTPGRAFAASCTVAGSATLDFPDASTLAVPLNVGWNAYGFAVTRVEATPTATCTYANLK